MIAQLIITILATLSVTFPDCGDGPQPCVTWDQGMWVLDIGPARWTIGPPVDAGKDATGRQMWQAT